MASSNKLTPSRFGPGVNDFYLKTIESDSKINMSDCKLSDPSKSILSIAIHEVKLTARYHRIMYGDLPCSRLQNIQVKPEIQPMITCRVITRVINNTYS